MKTEWQVLMKPDFLSYLTKLTAKEVGQVMEKVNMLMQDPRPDSKVKKQLTHMPGRPYRIRSGRYRIFYNFDQTFVNIYSMDARNDDTYSDTQAPETPPSADVLVGLDVPMGDVVVTSSPQPDWDQKFASTRNRPLPEPITVELLQQLGVPTSYHPRLLRVRDQEALLTCPGVDDDYLLKIDAHMFERPIGDTMQQPDLVLHEIEDLLRYKQGELLTFLLKLSPDQEKYATWSQQATGPTLVKGGPGTGKSTVALYRVRSLLQQLLKQGQRQPEILFTTYTNALVKSSEQLLQQLLGADARYVRVGTADSIAYSILGKSGHLNDFEILDNQQALLALVQQALDEASFDGNPIQQLAQKQTLSKIGLDYLLQEFTTVIVARQLRSLIDYAKTSRAGRKVRLTALQRGGVWKVYQRWCALLQSTGQETWQQRRARAAELAASSHLSMHYDAVVIDEAQDLDPSALRMLIALCKAPNRLFITADANQSIYGSGFSWQDVHEYLKFQGRTAILRANYRSTAEIGEAAQSYLDHDTLEPEGIERKYVNNGPQPDVRRVLNLHHEAQLLAGYLRKASLALRHTHGSCAVLCPSEHVGRALATALQNQDLEATFMAGRDLDLSHTGIKVLTLKSSKGLEFPIVALAGFTQSSYPLLPTHIHEEERAELLARERRTVFVGMTRAMRTLLVILPAESNTPLFEGFDPTHWNFTRNLHTL